MNVNLPKQIKHLTVDGLLFRAHEYAKTLAEGGTRHKKTRREFRQSADGMEQQSYKRRNDNRIFFCERDDLDAGYGILY